MAKPKWHNLIIFFLVTGLFFCLTGTVQAAVSINGTTQDEMVETFDTLDSSVRNGDWYRTSNNESGTLAWNEGPVMYSYLRMYEATGDKTYLDRFTKHADSVLKTRDSERGVTDYRGQSLPAWRAGGNYTLDGKYYIFAAHTGMIASPLADFARIVEQENLTGYRDKAQVYLQAAEDAIAVHDDEWVDNGDVGYYKIREGAPMWSDGLGVPFNMYSSVGEAQISLYQATGDNTYLERATKLAKHFKNHLQLDQSTNSYIWNYWWGTAYSGWNQSNSPSTNTPSYKGYRVKEDTRHGVIDMRFARKAYDAGIVFNEQDMERFGNTVTNKLIKSSSSIAKFVDGSGTEDSIMRITPWTMLYPWAPEILNVDKVSPYNAGIGMAGLSLYCLALSDIDNWQKQDNSQPDNGQDDGTTDPGGQEPSEPDDSQDDGTGDSGNQEPSEPGDEQDNNPTPPGDEGPSGNELVTNGNFADGHSGWNNSGEIKTDQDGNHFISNGYNWTLRQDLQLEPGKTYTFDARTRKGTASNEARLVVVGINGNGQIIQDNTIDFRHDHNGNEWESIPEQEFTVPEGAVKTRIYLLVNGGSGTHDFDNISVQPVQNNTTPSEPGDGQDSNPTPPGDEEPSDNELVANSNFVDGRSGWNVGNAGEINNDRDGNHFISNGYNWSLGQDLQLEPGSTYTFNAKTRKGTASNEARLIVVGISADERIISDNMIDLRYEHDGSGWESIPEQEFTVPEGAVKTRIYLLVNGGSGTHDFDNISVQPVQNNSSNELVVNGSFTEERTGWNVGNAGEINNDRDGNQFISNGYNWSLGQDLQLEPGSTYTFNAKTRKGTASNEARLIVVGISADERIISDNMIDFRHNHDGNGWESIPQQEFTVPESAVKTRIYLLVNGGSGTHDFDNISVQPL